MSVNRTEKRQQRIEHNNIAYDLQWRGAIEGALRWTLYGAVACAVGHLTWPFFRRQTWALKGFITSSASVAGVVIGADDYLLKHEHTVRRSENSLRRQARNELAREGKIATESEIRKWKVAKTERDAESGKEKEGLVRREIERMDMEKRETEVRGAAEGRGVEQRQVERGTDNQKEADALGNRVEDMTRIEPEARGIPDEHP